MRLIQASFVVYAFTSLLIPQAFSTEVRCSVFMNVPPWEVMLLRKSKDPEFIRGVLREIRLQQVDIISLDDPGLFLRLQRWWGPEHRPAELQKEWEDLQSVLGRFYRPNNRDDAFMVVNMKGDQFLVAKTVLHEGAHFLIGSRYGAGASEASIIRSIMRDHNNPRRDSFYILVDELFAYWIEASKMRSKTPSSLVAVIKLLEIEYSHLTSRAGDYFWAFIYLMYKSKGVKNINDLEPMDLIELARRTTYEEIESIVFKNYGDGNNFRSFRFFVRSNFSNVKPYWD